MRDDGADPGAWLSGLSGRVEWGTARTARVLARLGDPHLAYPVVHVGGTNGKGSVSALVGGALGASGRRTGVFSSPPLVLLRDCVAVDGLPVAKDVFAAALDRVRPAAVAEDATAFEALTAVAFEAFRRAGVEAAVVEVGMGGADDATSVVRPVVVVLTNVALDHVRELGPDVASIARVKAGLIRPRVPVVTAATGDALTVLRRRAEEVGAPLVVVDSRDVRVEDVSLGGTRFRLRLASGAEERFQLALVGQQQALNAAVSVRTIEHLPADLRPTIDEVRAGFARVRLPGRLSSVEADGVRWIFDVAHNPDGVRTLEDTLGRLSIDRPLVALVGILADKDWPTMLDALSGMADELVVTTAPSVPAERRWSLKDVEDCRRGRRWHVVEDFGAAVDLARTLVPADASSSTRGTVLVTGSFYTVADAMRHLDREGVPGVGLAPATE
jgi:dihydrofolate synthase/folylpolyglutamate synthase